MNTRYYDVFKLFDDVFEGVFDSFKEPVRFNSAVASAAFPPSNVLLDKDTKDLRIQVALAGYSQENINLSFDGDYLKLIVEKNWTDKTLPEGVTSTEVVLQRGIKLPNYFETKWNIDPRYYSRESVSVEFIDGLLTIVVKPRDEVAPKKIPLFGSLTLEDKSKKKLEDSNK